MDRGGREHIILTLRRLLASRCTPCAGNFPAKRWVWAAASALAGRNTFLPEVKTAATQRNHNLERKKKPKTTKLKETK
jgi:hypothetical protein